MNQKPPSLITLMFLISFASVGAVLYTPAIPGIATDFGVGIGQAQNTVTYFLLGYAFGQLPYGAVLNYLGRKPTIYLGCSLAIAGSFLCILADILDQFWLLNTGRVVMAIGMAVGLVSTFTLIGDTMEQKAAQRAISYVTLAFAIMPGVSILIGGFLTAYLGWVACFYFMAAYSLWVLFLASRLPTTGPPPFTHSIHPGMVLRGLWQQAMTPSVLFGGLIMGASTGVIYVFSSKAPFIGIDLIGLLPDDYGLLMLIPTAGAICGALISAYLSTRFSARILVWLGTSGMCFFIAIFLITFTFGWINPYTLFVPTAFTYLWITTAYAAISSSITAEATDKSNASAFMAFLNMVVAALAVLIASLVFTKSALFLPILQMLLVLAMFIGLLSYIRISRRSHA